MKADRVTIHCSVTPNGKYISLDDFRKWHVEENGWSNIGYHAIFQPDGTVHDYRNGLRALNVQGAGVAGANKNTIHYCLVGTDRFSIKQFVSMRYYLESLHQLYNIGPWRIRCHYEFDSARKQGKTCPNMLVGELVAWYSGNCHQAIAPYVLK